ncbi:LytR C-terminal domain-containing protein [Aquihabitans daechungensis]|uniref:LCP family protein n=1 Tax=Aquihabitans daechungensis TaxID=1052257 RepID=UPI003BA0259D
MTPEQPPSPSRRPRPGAEARRRALGLDGDGALAAPDPGAAVETTPVARRESLRDSLARIPDLAPDEPILVAPAAAPTKQAAPAPSVAPAGAAVAAEPSGSVATEARTTPADPAVPDDAPAERSSLGFVAPVAPPARPVDDRPAPDRLAATAPAPGGSGSEPPVVTSREGRRKPPMWRRVAFAIVLLGLVASIPVLVYAGSKLISESKDGDYAGTTLSPTDPGYEAQVDRTPTAVAIQYDDEHKPTGVTFLTLAGGEGGGSVIFVPLDTEVTEPSFGVDRLRTAYSLVADRPTVARERLASQVGRLLNVGVDEIIDLDNAGWEQLVTPVGPLTIDNPDQIDLGFGQVIPSGETTLTPAQTGAYLAATIEGESDLNRMARHEAVWSAWLEQLASSGKAEAVPGESTAGISKFAEALASGPVTFDTLPVNTVPGLYPKFRIDEPEVNKLITDTVASPTAAVPGSRFTVRLLNGVAPEAIPADLVREIVGRGGAVTILGNGPEFGTEETTVVYANPADKDLAKLVAKSMGATGKVRLDREAPDTVDLTIVLGKDVLGDATGAGSPGATTPDTASGGD